MQEASASKIGDPCGRPIHQVCGSLDFEMPVRAWCLGNTKVQNTARQPIGHGGLAGIRVQARADQVLKKIGETIPVAIVVGL